MQKIKPFLWYDKQARVAAAYYSSAFGGASSAPDVSVLSDTPSGSVDVVSVNLLGVDFTLMSAGPLFTFTPAVSFLVACKSKDEVSAYWEKLAAGGKVMMELSTYPFSEKYGWTQDQYGVSWQVMYMGERPVTQGIIPTLMFSGKESGNAEKAIALYASVFSNSKTGDIMRYEKNEQPDVDSTVKHAGFTLSDMEFAAMDGGHMHEFSFTEATSFEVACDTQQEIDAYWGALSAVPASEQCGWLKDKYGVSWQIVPSALGKMLSDPDSAKVKRVTDAFLSMKKFDIAKLEKAYAGQ